MDQILFWRYGHLYFYKSTIKWWPGNCSRCKWYVSIPGKSSAFNAAFLGKYVDINRNRSVKLTCTIASQRESMICTISFLTRTHVVWVSSMDTHTMTIDIWLRTACGLCAHSGVDGISLFASVVQYSITYDTPPNLGSRPFLDSVARYAHISYPLGVPGTPWHVGL